MTTSARTATDLMVRLSAVEGVVFDIDGALVLSDLPGGHGGAPLPGAVEAIEAIRASGRTSVVFTNASSQVPADIAASLTAMGFQLGVDDVLTPSVVAAEVILSRYGHGPVLAFGGPGLTDVLDAAGIERTDLDRPTEAVAVIVGWDVAFDRTKLQSACEAVWNGAPVLVTSDARRFASATKAQAGVGGFIAAGLKYVSGVDYEVVGKPSAAAMDIAARRLGTAPRHVLVAGDDLNLEVDMALAAGAIGVLVTTGMHGRDDAAAREADRAPHLIVDRLAELVEQIRLADRAAGRGPAA
ncbi:MAG: HAD hydrolase-like protein [Ornithinimicrobium sp.]